MANAVAETTEQTIELPRFGTLTYTERDLIVFPWGLPGFDQLKTFLVISLERQEHLVWLQSLDDLSVALPAADPWAFFPEYEPKLPSFVRFSLDLERPEDFTLLGIVVVLDNGQMYMNLMAPVVVNLKSRVARQVALEAGGYSVATPIPTTVVSSDEQAEAVPE